MLENDEKQLALAAVRTAMQHVIEEQNALSEDIDQLLKIPLKIPNSEEMASDATTALALAASIPNFQHRWLADELDQIPDMELRGSLGTYSAAVRQLEYLRATQCFLRIVIQSS